MLRTFSKLHGLAGLRLGWGYGNSKLINYLMAVRGPFSVNSIAIEAGIIAMKIDESRKTGKIIDLNDSWDKLDSNLKR